MRSLKDKVIGFTSGDLAGDCLHETEHVLGAMVGLSHQKLKLLLGTSSFGNVLNHNDEIVDCASLLRTQLTVPRSQTIAPSLRRAHGADTEQGLRIGKGKARDRYKTRLGIEHSHGDWRLLDEQFELGLALGDWYSCWLALRGIAGHFRGADCALLCRHVSRIINGCDVLRVRIHLFIGGFVVLWFATVCREVPGASAENHGCSRGEQMRRHVAYRQRVDLF